MKLLTFLTRVFRLGLLGCCLLAAASAAPGVSQGGFRKIFALRFSQDNITHQKSPQNSRPGRRATSWTVPVNSSITVALAEYGHKLARPGTVPGFFYGQPRNPADDRSLASTLADHPEPWLFLEQCQQVYWNIQRKELRS